MMGGDIAYECISPGKYKLVIKIYRDCRGIPFNSPSIGMFCKDGSNPITVNYTRTAINDITEVCDADPKPCSPQNTTILKKGTEEHVFEAIIDFNTAPYKSFKDNGCCEVMIKVEQNARNSALSTLVAGNFYTDAMINICKIGDKCNTSPQLTTPPVAFICCNQPFTFNNGVREVIDGDSLSYSLVNPLKANQTNETYLGSFSSNFPMTPYCPGQIGALNCRPIPNAKPPRGFYFDKETGDIIFTPTKCDEAGVIVIRIDEWRKNPKTKEWELIGYTKRDMQLLVQTCPDNNPPYFVQDKNKHSICEGEKICFTIVTKDDPFLPNQVIPDTLALTWNNGIPEGTFRIVDPSAREKSAEFCWQTKIGDARPNSYSFTATVKDNNCDNPAMANRGYNITVKPKARSTRQYNIGNCGMLYFKASPVDSVNQKKSLYNYQFTIRDSTNSGVPFYSGYKQHDSFKFKRGGKYIIEHKVVNSQYNCPTIYTDTVIMPPVLDVTLAFDKDTFVCEGNNLTLEPKVANGVPSYKYRWETPINTFNSKDTLPTFTLIQPKANAYIMLQLTDKYKCVDRDTIFVLYQPNPRVDIGPDQRICTYESVTLDAQHNDTMRYFWQPNGDSSRTIKINIAGKYIAKVIDKLGCNSTDTMELFVNDTVKILPNEDKEICFNDTLKIKGMRSPVAYPKTVVWKDIATGATIANDSAWRLKITTLSTKQYEMYLKIVQQNHACETRDTFKLTVNALPTFKFNEFPSRCYADGAVNLTQIPFATANSGDKKQTENNLRYYQNKKPSWITGGPVYVNSYKWNFPDFIKNEQIPSTGLRDSICVDYRDYKGCYNKECKVVKLNPNPVVELKEGVYCQRAGDVKLDNLVVKPFIKAGGIQSFRVIDVPSGSGLDASNLLYNQGFPEETYLNVGVEGENERTGDYRIEYCFKNGLTSCQTCDTTTVTIIKLPEIQFTPLPSRCINDALLTLDSFAKDRNTGKRFVNGIWSAIEFGGSRDMSNPTIAKKLNNSVKNNKDFDASYGPGKFLIKLSDESSGCPVSDSLEINVNGLPIIQIEVPDTVCSSSNAVDLVNIQPSGAVGKWSGQGVIGRQFNAGISPLNKQYEGKYTVTYTYTNPLTGCTASDSQKILIQSQPSISILNSKPYQQCEGTPFDLESQIKFAKGIVWRTEGDGNFSSNSSLKTIYQHGIKDTSINDLNGRLRLFVESVKEGVCPVVNDKIDLIIEPFPQFNFVADPEIQCEPALVNFNATVNKPLNTPNLQYYWYFGNGDSLTNTTTFNPQNVRYDTANRDWYDVRLKVVNVWGNGKVCASELLVKDMIKVLPQPKVGFNSDPGFFTTVAFPKFKFNNTTSIRWSNPGKLTYEWNFDNKNADDTSTLTHPVHTYTNDTAVYWVNLLARYTYTFNNNDYVCYDSLSQLRKIGPDVTVFVPTAFSPEGTGPKTNEAFRAIVLGDKTFNIQLYNRWGEKLWETDDKHQGWNGIYKNIPCQQGVYMWKIQVTAYDGKAYEYEGTVTLLR